MDHDKRKPGGRLYFTIAVGVLVAVVVIALIAGIRVPLSGIN